MNTAHSQALSPDELLREVDRLDKSQLRPFAQLRGVPLTDLMTELGIEPSPVE